MKQNRFYLSVSLLSLMLLVSLLGACAPQTAELTPTSETEPTVEVLSTGSATEPSATDTSVPATVEVSQPAVVEFIEGSQLVWAHPDQPQTLDQQKDVSLILALIDNYLQATLVTKDLDGNYVPYLAESWAVSDDGLVYDFKLREDVLFHNGDPVKAQDWVYTIDRGLDPETASPSTATMLTPVKSYEAISDYELRITMNEPYFPFIENLTSHYMAPISQRAVEEFGDQYGRNPVGTGPYKFKEWVQDDRLVLVRNPDYIWGAEEFPGKNTGAWPIETLIVRFMPEYSIALTGLLSNEIDYFLVQGKDLGEIESAGNFKVFEKISTLHQHFVINNQVPPFDNELVRKALMVGTDCESIVDVVLQGHGAVVKGPLTPSVVGYWPGIDEYAPDYDVEEAKRLLEEAGYVYGDDGMASLNGEPFNISIQVHSLEVDIKYAQVAQQQWKNLGINVTIEQYDFSTIIDKLFSGDFGVAEIGLSWAEADILYLWFHSSQMDGGFNINYVSDPSLDEILAATRNQVDPEERQEMVNEAQRYIVDHALFVPCFAQSEFYTVNNSLQGVEFNSYTNNVIFSNVLIAD